MKSLFLFCALLLPSVISGLTKEAYETIKADVKAFLNVPGRKGMRNDQVRLAFHASIQKFDGCINRDDPNNRGLEEAIDLVEILYQDKGYKEKYGLSRADYWAINSIAIIEEASRISDKGCVFCDEQIPPHSIVFRSGREDCPTSPWYEPGNGGVVLPEPNLGRDKMMAYFAKGGDGGFDFSPEEVVALMGAHTLGNATREKSGYQGQWTPEERYFFNNRFYKEMLKPELKWIAKNVAGRLARGPDAKWQFKSISSIFQGLKNRPAMMFNTDFDVFYDIEVDEDGRPQCDPTPATLTCKKADTYDLAFSYAQDLQLWIDDFSAVFTKMLDNGYKQWKLKPLK